MQVSHWQLLFQSSNNNKPYVFLNPTKRFDSALKPYRMAFCGNRVSTWLRL